MASESESLLSEGAGSGRRCVCCNASQPRDGKLLHCLHVMCAACVRESVSATADAGSGSAGGELSVQCTRCWKKTCGLPALRGLELQHQLTDCYPLLYTAIESADDDDDDADSGRRLCDVCVENADETQQTPHEATFVCSSCDGGAVFCQLHADKHPKGRRYSGHEVRKLDGHRLSASADLGLGTGSLRNSRNCALHRQQAIILYCLDCKRPVCQKCMASGHSQHRYESVRAVADKQRAQLVAKTATYRACVESNTAYRASVESNDTSCPIAPLLVTVAMDTDVINEEATTASTVIANTFGRLRTILTETEDELRETVDRFLWQGIAKLQLSKQGLHSLADQHTTSLELCEALSSPESADLDVVRLSDVLIGTLSDLGQSLQKSRQPMERNTMTLLAESLEVVERSVKSLVRVSMSAQSSVAASTSPTLATSVLDLEDIGERPVDLQPYELPVDQQPYAAASARPPVATSAQDFELPVDLSRYAAPSARPAVAPSAQDFFDIPFGGQPVDLQPYVAASTRPAVATSAQDFELPVYLSRCAAPSARPAVAPSAQDFFDLSGQPVGLQPYVAASTRPAVATSAQDFELPVDLSRYAAPSARLAVAPSAQDFFLQPYVAASTRPAVATSAQDFGLPVDLSRYAAPTARPAVATSAQDFFYRAPARPLYKPPPNRLGPPHSFPASPRPALATLVDSMSAPPSFPASAGPALATSVDSVSPPFLYPFPPQKPEGKAK